MANERLFAVGQRVYVDGENDYGTVTSDAGFHNGWDAGVAVRMDADGVIVNAAHAQLRAVAWVVTENTPGYMPDVGLNSGPASSDG